MPLTCDFWSGRLDSNQRPHGPEPCALPNCATSRWCHMLPLREAHPGAYVRPSANSHRPSVDFTQTGRVALFRAKTISFSGQFPVELPVKPVRKENMQAVYLHLLGTANR